MSTTRVRTRHSPQKRAAEIVDAALALAREGGLTALTSRAIADRAGVAPGLVSHYQPSMDALVAHVFSMVVAAEVDEVRRLLAAQDSPTARAAALFSTLLDPTRDDVTIIWVEAWALGRRNPPLASAIGEQMDAWHDLVLEVIEEGRMRGVFVVDDPGLVAWQLLGMIDGLAAHALVRGADLAVFHQQLARAGEVLLGAATGSVLSG